MAFWYFEVKNCQIIGREDDFSEAFKFGDWLAVQCGDYPMTHGRKEVRRRELWKGELHNR